MKLLFLLILFYSAIAAAREIAITIDDLKTADSFTLSSEERSKKMLAAFEKHRIKTTLFICGKRIDSEKGIKLLNIWNSKGHKIGNHTYSHSNYNLENISSENYKKDFDKVDKLISKFSNYSKIFRYPYLKQGNTKEKRDGFREYLSKNSYSYGYVTVDASDWYINQRMQKKMHSDPNFDLNRYRDYYLYHIWDRAQYYDSLAKKVLKKEITHTLLIHDNLLNALFLDDLIQMFKNKGWKVIDSSLAFKDPIFKKEPNILPAGESIVWAMAKESGYSSLRYPAESGSYQKKEMDDLGL